MSFSSQDGDAIAVVNGGKADGEIVYIEDENEKSARLIKKKPTKIVEVEDGKFELLPNPKIRVIMVSGPSGSGKSTWCAQYIKRYLKENRKAQFHIFSQITEDECLDKLKPHRITLDESLIENPINIEEIEPNSIILFDDCNDNEPALQKAINRLESQLLNHGRHNNIAVVITSHLINGNERSVSRHRLNEMQALVVFPKAGSCYSINYALKTVYGLSTRQSQAVLDIDSRWICLTKVYPQVLISEHFLTFTRDIGKK